MELRLLTLYAISSIFSLALYVLRRLLRRKIRQVSKPTSLLRRIGILLIGATFWYGFVWVWSNSFHTKDLIIIVVFTVLGALTSLAILYSYDNEVRDWLVTGGQIAIELTLTSLPTLLIRLLVTLVGSASIWIIMLLTTITLWPTHGTYVRAVSLAGVILIVTVGINAFAFLPLIVYPALDDTSRLNLALILLSASIPAMVFASLGDPGWPASISFEIGKSRHAISSLVPVFGLLLAILVVIPALVGSNRRQRWHLLMLRDEAALIERFAQELSEYDIDRPSLVGLEDIVFNVETRRAYWVKRTFGLPQLLLRLLNQDSDGAYDRYSAFLLADILDVRQDIQTLSARASRVLAKRADRLQFPTNPWETRSNWSQVTRNLSALTRHLTLVVVFSYRELYDELPKLAKLLLVWTRFAPPATYLRLIEWRVRFQSLVAAVDGLPDDDPRWRHVIRLSSLRDRMTRTISELESYTTMHEGMDQSLEKLVLRFNDELRTTTDLSQRVRDTKRLGARLLIPLLVPVLMAFGTPFLQSLAGLR